MPAAPAAAAGAARAPSPAPRSFAQAALPLVVVGAACFGAGVLAHRASAAAGRRRRATAAAAEAAATGAAQAPARESAAARQMRRATDLDTAGAPLRRLRKCETVLSRRTSRVVVVLERTCKSHNYSAVMRTAEALGVQHLWVVAPPDLDADAARRAALAPRKQWKADQTALHQHVAFARKAQRWIDVREFADSASCIAAARADGRQLWVSDLSQEAVCLTAAPLRVPRIALVIGTESTGASAAMLRAADRRVYLPLHGFADSLNLSVAAALLLQRLLFADPTIVGDMPHAERAARRRDWYVRMARGEDEETEYAEMAEAQNAALAAAADGNAAAAALPVPAFDDMRRPSSHRSGWVTNKISNRNAAEGFESGIGVDGGDSNANADADAAANAAAATE